MSADHPAAGRLEAGAPLQAPARVDPSALAASLRRLHQQHEGAVLEQSLRRVLDSCVELFGVSGSGLMLADEHSDLHYAVATDPASQRLETAELEAGEGPCVETFLRDEIVSCDDLMTDPRWPRLSERVADMGVGAVLGVPVRLGDVTVGSLDVYLTEPHAWDASEISALERFGRIADAMIAAAVGAEQAGELAAQLGYALEYRAPIERAIGYLMARDGIGQTAAFNMLRTAARSSRRKIGEVAAELLERGTLPTEAP